MQRAAGEHVAPVGFLERGGGAAGGEDAHRPDDDRSKARVEGETGVFEDRGHEDDEGGDACVLAEEEESSRDGERP